MRLMIDSADTFFFPPGGQNPRSRPIEVNGSCGEGERPYESNPLLQIIVTFCWGAARPCAAGSAGRKILLVRNFARNVAARSRRFVPVAALRIRHHPDLVEIAASRCPPGVPATGAILRRKRARDSKPGQTARHQRAPRRLRGRRSERAPARTLPRQAGWSRNSESCERRVQSGSGPINGTYWLAPRKPDVDEAVMSNQNKPKCNHGAFLTGRRKSSISQDLKTFSGTTNTVSTAGAAVLKQDNFLVRTVSAMILLLA